MQFSKELTKIPNKTNRSAIDELMSLIESKFPRLTETLPESYKNELRKRIVTNKNYDYRDGKNAIHILTDCENLKGELAVSNDDDVKVLFDLPMPPHLFYKLLHDKNTWNLDNMISLNSTYHSFPVKVVISGNEVGMLQPDTFDTMIEFPIYAFKQCLKKMGFELKKKETNKKGTAYDLIW